jgi:hypothetical protein
MYIFSQMETLFSLRHPALCAAVRMLFDSPAGTFHTSPSKGEDRKHGE